MKDKIREEKLKKRQKRLFEMLPNDYYHKVELMAILDMSYAQIDNITKKLTWYPGKGYKKFDVVLKLSGGQLIAD